MSKNKNDETVSKKLNVWFEDQKDDNSLIKGRRRGYDVEQTLCKVDEVMYSKKQQPTLSQESNITMSTKPRMLTWSR